ncbi:MAG: roadblock/LC7 domain-containing protein [Candidatus Thermoplasmatota archaeon]
MELKPALRALRQSCGSIASAIISRDGLVIAADLPEGVSMDTFSIMCATLIGAASTANSELRVGTPQSVLVESEDARMLVVGAGRKALIVTVLPMRADPGLAKKELLKLADTIKMI